MDKEACQDLAAKAMHGKGHLHREDAGDIWHTMCLQQDCGSMLPSRSKDLSACGRYSAGSWVGAERARVSVDSGRVRCNGAQRSSGDGAVLERRASSSHARNRADARRAHGACVAPERRQRCTSGARRSSGT